jgi:hypothetical protein
MLVKKMPRGQPYARLPRSRWNGLELAIDMVGYGLPKGNRTALNGRGVDRKKGWQGTLSS